MNMLEPEIRFDLSRWNARDLPPDPATWTEGDLYDLAFPGGLHFLIGGLDLGSVEDPMLRAAVGLLRLLRHLYDGETRGFEWMETHDDLIFARRGDAVRVFYRDTPEEWGIVGYEPLLDALTDAARTVVTEMLARFPALERNPTFAAVWKELRGGQDAGAPLQDA